MANKVIKSVNLLPEFLRTDKNSKFLSSTLDQLIQPPQLERIDGYIGSKLTPTYNALTDFYIPETLSLRSAYQLDPALVIKDSLGVINDVIALGDLANEITTQGGISNNFDRLFRSEFYSYTPHIDWDKLVNYQEYYWLVNGPNTILITGNLDIKTNQYDVLNVADDILGKSTYTSTSGVKLSNGMKIRFGGATYPESYLDNEFFVEGVGTSITLISYQLLSGTSNIASVYNDYFDTQPFDSYPYDNSERLPVEPDYITINRASRDVNPWSQYNRWVHSDVINVTALANGQVPLYPAENRARRPIIEFKANLKLFNFGSSGIENIDLIDNTTLDAFSIVENSAGYYVDGVLLEQGNRVVFNADTNSAVRGKIYQVEYVNIQNSLKLTLVLVDTPVEFTSTGVNLGNTQAGTNWWFTGDVWQFSQQRITTNQAPLFDLFDNDGHSYSDTTHHLSNFAGNKIFGYDVGTGVNDAVLGFPLKYKNSVGVGSYLFKNYFSSEIISLVINNLETTISTGTAYCKFNDSKFVNVWKSAAAYQIPILQFQSTVGVTSTIELTAIDASTNDVSLDVLVNNSAVSNYTITKTDGKFSINFSTPLPDSSSVLFKIRTDTTPTKSGYYEPPLGLTNNPLNGPITSLTLSELSDHLHTIVSNSAGFVGKFPGANNLRDLSDADSPGTRLIANALPMAFASVFIGKKEHSVIDAITKAGDQYNQFKMAFLKRISEINDQTSTILDLDRVLVELNINKDLISPYYLSDMIAYGSDKDSRNWTVTDSRNVIYPLISEFNPAVLSARSVLVYLNNVQLVLNRDYEFDVIDAAVKILLPLSVGDKIVVNDYRSTNGSFIPPTPSKLGLHPAYYPSIYLDRTYATPTTVIQGHDGSITVAYNDFRDAIILEFEKRIFNNIKAHYRPELFDINSIFAGAFRSSEYSEEEINKILSGDFLKWTGFYGIDYTVNNSLNEDNAYTWNYQTGFSTQLGQSASGAWRAIFKRFYDTDRPNTHPWEMLGIANKPLWWEKEYGTAPYTAGNGILWGDLEQGLNRGTGTVDPLYARSGLFEILPVTDSGELVDILLLVTNWTLFGRRQSWKFGDQAPAETAWRRSSYWPFAVQRLLALAKPAKYSALMYDPSRVLKNIAEQWTYGPNHVFLNPKDSVIHGHDNALTSGYSVYVSEIGRQRTLNYTQELSQDLAYLDFNLFHKVGGFVSKDKLQIIIDAIDPTSTSPGAILPQEDYELVLNTSNPIKSSAISGIIVQKDNGKFVIKGYDKLHPYFTVREPIRNTNTAAITIGGISESYVTWASGTTSGATGLSVADTTTASSASTGKFYQAGQIVSNGSNFYRVKTSHQSGAVFNLVYFQLLSGLPTVGGATVQSATKFDVVEKQVSYGTEYNTLQEVYDLIIGYGNWLETQGFIFDEYNSELSSSIDWNFTGKEFLYWTTQNWAPNSIITLSPFASQIKYQLANSVVDSIFDSFYEYNILQANGTTMPQNNLNVNRQDGVCTIATVNSADGIYFAVLHSVQKEHAMVFKNTTMFNDTIYDIESGYRQHRMKLVGFRTANWNGDYFSPGFVYDTAQISEWKKYSDYRIGDVVRFGGTYYSSNKKIIASSKFDFTEWDVLGNKPVAGLLPNFDYKINQFEDFYSLDIDNFDSAQQKMAQHLIGYTPRVYLNNIFTNPIAQYKFYQGFIKEKGTKNSISKLAKASLNNLQGELTFTEEWAFRIGQYGSYETYQELEVPLIEGTFVDNPQIVKFVDVNELPAPNDLIYYSTASNRIITPTDYIPTSTFVTTDAEFEFATAGYARLDDVTFTAYSETSLLDIANNGSINQGDVIWMGFKQDGDWDVLRYVNSTAKIIQAELSDPGVEITFTTDIAHDLYDGATISITQFDSVVDGIYVVKYISSLDSFTAVTTLDEIPEVTPTGPAQIFRFDSARYAGFDALPVDSDLLNQPIGTKFWVNNDGSGKWIVYEKIKNYSSIANFSSIGQTGQKLGWSISNRPGSAIAVVGAPGNYEYDNQGGVYVYTNLDNRLKFKYTLNHSVNYQVPGTPTEFGYTVVYDDCTFSNSGFGLIFAGAPAASNVKGSGAIGSVRYSTGTEVASTLMQEGLVKISSIDAVANDESDRAFVLLSPQPSSHERFGTSIFVERNTNDKLLLVGAPQTLTTGTGTVYHYTVNSAATTNVYYAVSTTAVVDVSFNNVLESAVSLTQGSQWGYAISGSDNADIIAVSAPGYSNNTGVVQLYSRTTWITTITSPYERNGRFGETIAVSPSGDYLFIAAPNIRNNDLSYGKVAVYKIKNSAITFISDIANPLPNSAMKFGSAVTINSTSDTLVISALGTNSRIPTTFDQYDSAALFDAASTSFYSEVDNSGTVYVYHRKFNRFVLSEELPPLSTAAGTCYGKSIAIDTTTIFVGAPAIDNSEIPSVFHKFKTTAPDSLAVLRHQDDVVTVDTIQKVMIIDSFKEEVVEYLDVIDPLKGKIAGIADQELKYKTAYDPAVYTIGIASTVNDTSTSWIDNHLGELWWDLSTVKYQWYEQGELSFRKNNWGQLFPGSTIDIYEWVSSKFLPSEWSAIADTASGLTEGISGQPKFINDNVVSVKQIYNSLTGAFSNQYYYWVKNKVTVPDVSNRRISCYQVSSIITNPTNYGLQYASVISKDAILLSNIKSMLVSDRIHINIATDAINSIIPKHTEWLLMQEGSAESRPNTLLEKKLIDSLIGHDSFGTLVPDPLLTSRTRYGIGIRPQQTLFKNRLSALRNLVEFTNSILIKNQITSNYNFANLNKQELIPDQYSRAYDQIVEDNEGLLTIDARRFSLPELSCTVQNGKIRSVSIDNPGFGYKIAPTVTVVSDVLSAAKISTEIDAYGRITAAIIDDAGANFPDNQSPSLQVRPYTVIVLADNLYNNKWTKFIYDISGNSWIRSCTQKFNTPMYWKYQDWSSSGYNQYIDYVATIDDVYQLNIVTVEAGQYVKVRNCGDGRYIILEKVQGTTVGTFSNHYDIVYSERGTIQILDSIWNFSANDYGFDYFNSYDQTLFDQTPDLELQYILSALKNDLFVNELKINWNLFFFKAVKYALSEQKLLDWAFKTSFINVKNLAGSLDQRPIYKLQNSEYFEKYVNEVKPYHTSIRTFTTDYTTLEESKSYTTDFDLPSVYNKSTGMFTTAEANVALLDNYPWKSWASNNSFTIGKVSVSRPGAGYTSIPDVTITAALGDTGSGATAIAYINSGRVVSLALTSAGSGYKTAPVITITGGGAMTLATAYAQLFNGKVRTNKIGMKFDRISRTDQTGARSVTDRFICNGADNKFVLSWLAEPDKFKIQVSLDKSAVLRSDYTIEYYTDTYNGYNKKFNRIHFINFDPVIDQVLEITYVKSTDLLNATERILSYYSPTSGMPGMDLTQLMTGMAYPNTSVDSLPLGYSNSLDAGYIPTNSSAQTDAVSYYTTSKIAATATAGTTLITLTTTTGLTVGQYANITGSTVNKFSTTSDVVITSINTASHTVGFSSELSGTVYPGCDIEFWNYDGNSAVLDSTIDGGTWNTSTRVNALGINPEDVTIDGDSFLSVASSYAPEELVPGFVTESVGINVYTKNPQGAPVVFAGSVDIIAGTTSTSRLIIVPPSAANVVVVFNNSLFNYSTTTNFTSSTQFTINWKNNEIIVPPQLTTGKLGYTILSIGGGRADTEAGVVDSAMVTVSGKNFAQVESLSAYTSIKCAYVTVNGIKISPVTTSTDYGYMLTYASSANHRAAVNVYNLQPGTNTVQAWFFNNEYRYFNEVNEETIIIDGSVQKYTLRRPPGITDPGVTQSIVEITDAKGNRTRLLPPFVSYYDIKNSSNRVFAIDKNTAHPAGTFDSQHVRAYVNGIKLRQDYDYTVDSVASTIKIKTAVLLSNSTVAIVGLPSDAAGLQVGYDYDIDGSTLTMVDPKSNYTYKVITYTDHDGMMIRTERFNGNPNKRYKISRQVLNDNYVWATVNGIPMTSKLDYNMLDDQVTVEFSDQHQHASTDNVVITSISSEKLASTILGYRIFNDIFDRTHFKRLSKQNTTYLTATLNFADTEIHVANARSLTPPLISKKIPGVIIIDGERIEFFKITGNVLQQLRRSTLGTAPSLRSEINTWVIDQSPEQTIPFKENIYRQTHITTSGTATYIISKTSSVVNTGTQHQITSDGITLSLGAVAAPVDNFVDNTLVYRKEIPASDQVAVYYGGHLLRKSGIYHQDTTLSYDSPECRILGTLAELSLLPYTTIIGTAYVISDTNQVWVYTKSTSADAANGYVFCGLTYLPPEFTIDAATQAITLNIQHGVRDNVKLDIVKKQVNQLDVWNTTIDGHVESLMDSTTAPAKFLQRKPAELPDRYYYGGNQ